MVIDWGSATSEVDLSLVVLASLNLAAIGALPRVFFRRGGQLNVRWWLTAAPFFAAGMVLMLAVVGVFDDGASAPLGEVRTVAATVLHVTSIALIGLTVGTHRIPLALWHQDDDAPQHIVTWGPYRLVRHPFYVAFVVALLGVLVTFPHPVVGAVTAYAVVALDLTARREERRLLGSDLGADYRRYMGATGRWVPGVGRAA